MTSEAERNLRRFLQDRALAMSDLEGALEAFLAGCALAGVVGSVPEGLATSRSDLDVLLVAESEGLVSGDPIRLEDRLRVDVAVVSVARIVELAATLRTLTHRARTMPDVLKLLSWDDHRLLHRASNCFPLRVTATGRELGEQLRSLPLAEALARHSYLYAFSYQDDLAGFLLDGDSLSAAALLPEHLGAVVDVLLHTLGDTNPAPKFRVRRLDRMEDAIASVRVAGEPLPRPFARWYGRFLAGLEDTSVEARSRASIRLQNQIVPWSQDALA